jgi:membrane fusion protein (multidrug efflux system)
MAGIGKRVAIGLGAVVLVGAAVAYGAYYWTEGRFEIATNDAYVKADYTIVAPKVPGYLAAVLVADNQHVAAGQVLARIDDRDYRTSLDQAEADVATAAADIRNFDAELLRQNAVVAEAAAAITVDQAALQFSRGDQLRYAALRVDGAGTAQRAQAADADLREKSATITRDEAALEAARGQTLVLAAGREKAAATLGHYRAVAQQAALNLGYTELKAPIAGTVGDRSLRVGQYVQAGTALMALVPLKAVYVVANFKETQLTRIRAGQPVTIAVDSFPDKVLHGRVDSVAPASGLEFALLPPDNATGNFTKIVQRVPVRIVLDPKDPLIGLLRPGMSVEATVDTIGLKD